MTIRGKKVVLRPVRLDDAPRFVAWFNNPSVNRYLHIRKLTLPEEKQWVKTRKKERPQTTFAIDTSEGIHVGRTSLILDKRNNNASFGIMIGEPRYWGRGLGSETVQLMLDLAFRKMKLHRVELKVYSYNPRARKVYIRAGFCNEGIKREHVRFGGKYHDVHMMSILQREWLE